MMTPIYRNLMCLLSLTLFTPFSQLALAQTELVDEEKGIIILNPSDPGYDVWKAVRKDLSEGRKPGPINIHRLAVIILGRVIVARMGFQAMS
jgi:hypothetical protein